MYYIYKVVDDVRYFIKQVETQREAMDFVFARITENHGKNTSFEAERGYTIGGGK